MDIFLIDWAILLSALIAVESPKNPQQAEAAIRREGAYGILQIRQICLDDVIMASGIEVTLEECARSETTSRWVCVEYLKKWGKHYYRTTGEKPTYEVLARIWNGGPRGWQKSATEKYWERIRVHL